MKYASRYYAQALETPVGQLVLLTSDDEVIALDWKREEQGTSVGGAVPNGAVSNGTVQGGSASTRSVVAGAGCTLLDEAAGQLREYLRGERRRFDLPLAPLGTDFQRRVWSELERIPYGQTWSYQELARRVGNPGAVRAVGTANGRNPLCIFIPCHRVVRLSGELGGYTGGLDKKTFLLKLEAAAR